MSISSTVSISARIFELGTEERANAARQWLQEHEHDLLKFQQQFPDAVIVASPGLGAKQA